MSQCFLWVSCTVLQCVPGLSRSVNHICGAEVCLYLEAAATDGRGWISFAEPVLASRVPTAAPICSSSISIAAYCSNQCLVAERAVWLAVDQQFCFHVAFSGSGGSARLDIEGPRYGSGAVALKLIADTLVNVMAFGLAAVHTEASTSSANPRLSSEEHFVASTQTGCCSHPKSA